VRIDHLRNETIQHAAPPHECGLRRHQKRPKRARPYICSCQLALIFQVTAGAVSEDVDLDEGPCSHCESQGHASRDCPHRQSGGGGWMHKAQVLFRNRRQQRDRSTAGSGRSSSSAQDGQREDSGQYYKAVVCDTALGCRLLLLFFHVLVCTAASLIFFDQTQRLLSQTSGLKPNKMVRLLLHFNTASAAE
jgi:hypothetical protein